MILEYIVEIFLGCFGDSLYMWKDSFTQDDSL